MGFLQKIQSLPEPKRKLILIIVVILVGILLFIFYIKSLKLRLESLKGEEIREQLKIPEFQERLKELPKIEMPELEIPEISEEELKQLEEEIKKAQE